MHHKVNTAARRARIVSKLTTRKWAASRGGYMLTGLQQHAQAATVPWVWLLSGAYLIGLGVIMIIAADFGAAPLDVFVLAIREQYLPGLTIGQVGWVVVAPLIGVALALGYRPRFSNLVYMFATGVSIDIAASFVTAPDGFLARCALFGTGMVIVFLGAAIVTHTGHGGGSYEMLARALRHRGLTRAEHHLRWVLDIAFLGFGALLGGPVGIGTAVFAIGGAFLFPALLQMLSAHDIGRGETGKPPLGESPMPNAPIRELIRGRN